MTAAAAGNLAKSKIRSAFLPEEEAQRERERNHRQTGEIIAKTLGELKGAAMKIGQMASMAADFLPTELSTALTQLQKQAPPIPFEVIAKQIKNELGEDPCTLFHHLDPQPFASASIGQVHRGRMDDGREIIVKVQYPGVDKAVDSDLTQLKFAMRAGGLLRLSKEDIQTTFDELRIRLHEELDYCNEADNLRAFREFHARHSWLVLPEVVGERSSQRILTLTYVQGDDIQTVKSSPIYNSEIRNQLGTRLLDLFLEQLFEFHCVHGDPHPGNYAFRADGTIVLYDFGCVKQLPKTIVQNYAALIKNGLVEDYEGLEQSLKDIGLRRKNTPDIPAAFYKKWRDIFAQSAIPGEIVDFSQLNWHEDILKLGPASIRYMSSFQPAKDLIFLDRAVFGTYCNLVQLEAKVAAHARIVPYLQRTLERNS